MPYSDATPSSASGCLGIQVQCAAIESLGFRQIATPPSGHGTSGERVRIVRRTSQRFVGDLVGFRGMMRGEQRANQPWIAGQLLGILLEEIRESLRGLFIAG